MKYLLNEVVFDFNDRLKSMTSGYASFDYEIMGHKEGDLVKLGINILDKIVDHFVIVEGNKTWQNNPKN